MFILNITVLYIDYQPRQTDPLYLVDNFLASLFPILVSCFHPSGVKPYV